MAIYLMLGILALLIKSLIFLPEIKGSSLEYRIFWFILVLYLFMLTSVTYRTFKLVELIVENM